MEIVGTAPSATTLTLANPDLAPPWQVGRRLDAVVTGIIGQGKITLNIGETVLEARTYLATNLGQRLHLEVIRSDSQIVLRITPPSPTSNPITVALREALPHQQPLQTIFAQFTTLLSSSSGLAPGVNMLLKQLLEAFPDQRTISRAAVFKQMVTDSGLFLEHKLSLGSESTALATDLKANLLRLLAEAKQSRDENANLVSRYAEAGLARIQLHQLSAVADSPTPSTALAGELPVRSDNSVDVFQFHIEKDAKDAANSKQQSWCTWLSFNIETLGPMYAKITLANQTVDAILWAESNLTVELLNKNLNYLHQSLSEVGLDIKGLQCFQGKPPLPAANRMPEGLLDLIA